MIATTDQIKNQLIPRLEKKFQQSGGNTSTDTTVSSSGLKVHIGNTPPTDPNVIWFDTSDYGE